MKSLQVMDGALRKAPRQTLQYKQKPAHDEPPDAVYVPLIKALSLKFPEIYLMCMKAVLRPTCLLLNIIKSV